MCGIFGFVGRRPDTELLREAITLAATRGPHAWGVVRLDGTPRSGYLRRMVRTAPLATQVDDALEFVDGSSAILGHARLATSGYGAAKAEDQAQPLLNSWATIALAHNGVVVDPAGIRAAYGLPDGRTGSDTEVLLQLLQSRNRETKDRMRWVLLEAGGALRAQAAVALDMIARAMIASSTGQPLYVTERPEGRYVCSRLLPGGERIQTWMARL